MPKTSLLRPLVATTGALWASLIGLHGTNYYAYNKLDSDNDGKVTKKEVEEFAKRENPETVRRTISLLSAVPFYDHYRETGNLLREATEK